MRHGFIFASTLLIAATAVFAAPKASMAAKRSPAASPSPAQATVVEAGWRRYMRRHPYVATAPAPMPVQTPAGIVWVTPRPTSCGEYRYWNGVACVDARFHNPNLAAEP